MAIRKKVEILAGIRVHSKMLEKIEEEVKKMKKEVNPVVAEIKRMEEFRSGEETTN